MIEQLKQLMKSLRLQKMITILEDELKLANKRQLSYEEFLQRLLLAQDQHRQETALQYRIKQAKRCCPKVS